MSFQMFGKTDKEILEAITFYNEWKHLNNKNAELLQIIRETIDLPYPVTAEVKLANIKAMFGIKPKVKQIDDAKLLTMTRNEALSYNYNPHLLDMLEALGLIKFKESEDSPTAYDYIIEEAEQYLKSNQGDRHAIYHKLILGLLRIIKKHFKTGYRFEHPPKSSPVDNWMK